MRHHYHEAKFMMQGERLRDFIFGYNDGSVTTLAIVVALWTAGASDFVIMLGALANIFGTGIAFMLGDYSSIRTQMNFIKTYKTDKKLTGHEKVEIKELISRFDNPWKIASIAFFAFMVAGVIAVAPFILLNGLPAMVGSVVTVLLSVFGVGLIRSKYTLRDPLRSGLEMMLVAAVAIAAAYFIGTYGLSMLEAGHV